MCCIIPGEFSIWARKGEKILTRLGGVGWAVRNIVDSTTDGGGSEHVIQDKKYNFIFCFRESDTADSKTTDNKTNEIPSAIQTTIANMAAAAKGVAPIMKTEPSTSMFVLFYCNDIPYLH